jgi:hypothetical protein
MTALKKKEIAMQWSKLVTMLVLLFAPICFGQVAPNTANEKPASPSFSITVDPPAAPIHIGSPINVTVTVTNISGKEIYWSSDRGKNSVYKAFAVLLTRDGRESETTFFHRRITGRQRPDDPAEVEDESSILLPHPPGKMFVMTIDLTRLYEIKDPGMYTLDLSRVDEYSKTTVHSKPVTLNVVP